MTLTNLEIKEEEPAIEQDLYPLAVYTPDSQLRTPGILLRSMWQSLGESRELAWRLFIRDVSAQYRQSIFGILWSFLPPLVTGLVFILLQSNNIISLGDTGIPYPVYALTGTMLWQIFVESLNAPLKSVNLAKPILVRISIPYESLILSSLYSVLFSLSIKLVVLAAIFIYFGLQPTWGLLVAPLGILLLILLGISIGLLLTPLGILYTDVGASLPVITQLWFFVTPVVYAPPTSFPFSLLTVINPVSPILIATRDLISLGYVDNYLPLAIIGVTGFVLLFFAWVIFRVAIPIIVERISA